MGGALDGKVALVAGATRGAGRGSAVEPGAAVATEPHFGFVESPRYVGRAVAADPDVARWNGTSPSSGHLARVHGFTDLDGGRPDSWRHIADGRPLDVTGYR